jgi:hypothetical protein
VKAWNAIEVVFDASKNAVPVGTVAGVQLAAVLKFELPGAVDHVASCARAGNAASNATAAVVVNKCVRIFAAPAAEFLSANWPVVLLTYAGGPNLSLRGCATRIVLWLWFARNTSREIFYGT